MIHATPFELPVLKTISRVEIISHSALFSSNNGRLLLKVTMHIVHFMYSLYNMAIKDLTISNVQDGRSVRRAIPTDCQMSATSEHDMTAFTRWPFL